jgi:hypothetical protein
VPPECKLKVEKFCAVQPPPGGTQCLGKVVSLRLEYTGVGCTGTNNPQSGKASCTGGANGAAPVSIQVTSKKGGPSYANAVGVPVSGIVFAQAATAGESQFDTDTVVVIRSGSTEVERIAFHTSCSQPLSAGDQFGSLRVVELTTTKGGTVSATPPAASTACTLTLGDCGKKGSKGTKASKGSKGSKGRGKCKEGRLITAGNLVTYSYRVMNTGGTTIANVSVADDKLGPIQTVPQLAPGATVTFTKMATINETTTNTARVTGSVKGAPGAVCEATAQATVTRQPPPPQCSGGIAAFRVQVVRDIPGTGTLRFVGEKGGAAEYPLPITAGDVLMLPAQNGFTIDAGAGKLGTKTNVFINGVLTEVLHTSCSCRTNNFVPGMPACLDAGSPDNPTGTKGEPSPLFLVETFRN